VQLREAGAYCSLGRADVRYGIQRLCREEIEHLLASLIIIIIIIIMAMMIRGLDGRACKFSKNEISEKFTQTVSWET
jgi:hypothetical protein